MEEKINPRYYNWNGSPDDNRHWSVLILDTISKQATGLSGLALGGIEAATVAVVDGLGNQITGFGGGVVAASKQGQAKIALTATAIQLGGNILSNGVIITAKSTNTANIHIGGSTVNNNEDGTGNGYILEPGASVSCAVTNTNLLYINGTTGDIISFIGS